MAWHAISLFKVCHEQAGIERETEAETERDRERRRETSINPYFFRVRSPLGRW